nr:MAG TPA: hypothetical protein [Caudoviricetes sp.]
MPALAASSTETAPLINKGVSTYFVGYVLTTSSLFRHFSSLYFKKPLK